MPGIHDDVIAGALDLGLSAVPREMGFGVGERGVEKGWAADVEVAGVACSVAVSCGERRLRALLNWRPEGRVARGMVERDRRRQRVQIIVCCDVGWWEILGQWSCGGEA